MFQCSIDFMCHGQRVNMIYMHIENVLDLLAVIWTSHRIVVVSVVNFGFILTAMLCVNDSRLEDATKEYFLRILHEE